MQAKVEETSSGRHFHVWQHHVDVNNAAFEIAGKERVRLTEEEKLVLEIAAHAHDVVYVAGAGDNEEKSAEFALETLKRLGVRNKSVLLRVKNAILTTKHLTSGYEPKTRVERILRDADLSGFAAPYERFDLNNVRVARESGIERGDSRWVTFHTGGFRLFSAINGGEMFWTEHGKRVLKPRAFANMERFRREHAPAV